MLLWVYKEKKGGNKGSEQLLNSSDGIKTMQAKGIWGSFLSPFPDVQSCETLQKLLQLVEIMTFCFEGWGERTESKKRLCSNCENQAEQLISAEDELVIHLSSKRFSHIFPMLDLFRSGWWAMGVKGVLFSLLLGFFYFWDYFAKIWSTFPVGFKRLWIH